MQPNLFDAMAERDEALTRVDENANAQWKQTCTNVVLLLARTRLTFTADDVWFYLEKHHDVSTHEPRALGAVLNQLSKAGRIHPTGGYAPSVRRHAAPIRVWAAV